MRRGTSKIASFLKLISIETTQGLSGSKQLSKVQNAHRMASSASFSRVQGTGACAPPFASSVTIGSQAFRTRNFTTDTVEENWNGILYPDNELRIGEMAPDFEAEAVIDGEIKQLKLSDYKGKYVVLFWYPKDFTFVCPTEIIAFSDRAKEFEALNCQLIAASTDTPEVHLAWCKTSRKRGGLGFMQIPLLADVTKNIAARYGVLKEDAGVALRGLYIINPEGVVEHATINNFPIGRSVDEALRTLQAIQYVAEHGEVCPANWKPGDKAMVADPEKSLDYFQAQEEAGAEDEDQAAGSNFVAIDDEKKFDTMVTKGKTVVKFWAPWCGKCRQIGPFTNEIAGQYKDMQFISVDTTEEKMEDVVNKLGVKGLPAFRFFKDGEEVVKPVIGYKKQPLQEAVQEFQKM